MLEPDIHLAFGLGNTHQFRDPEFALLKHVKQVVGQVDVALVDFVDEQYTRPFVGQQGGAERAELKIAPNVRGVPAGRLAS